MHVIFRVERAVNCSWIFHLTDLHRSQRWSRASLIQICLARRDPLDCFQGCLVATIQLLLLRGCYPTNSSKHNSTRQKGICGRFTSGINEGIDSVPCCRWSNDLWTSRRSIQRMTLLRCNRFRWRFQIQPKLLESFQFEGASQRKEPLVVGHKSLKLLRCTSRPSG